MPDPTIYSGFILNRVLHNEKFWLISILTKDYGCQTCLLRFLVKKTTIVPDLFDVAEIVLEKKKKGDDAPIFAKEYQLIKRNIGLSKEYKRLSYAAKWAIILAKNNFPQDNPHIIFKICENTIFALAEKQNPDAAYLKGIWLLLRENGYPIKEDWANRLTAEDFSILQNIIKTPLDNIQENPADLERIIDSLEQWLVFDLHFILINS